MACIASLYLAKTYKPTKSTLRFAGQCVAQLLWWLLCALNLTAYSCLFSWRFELLLHMKTFHSAVMLIICSLLIRQENDILKPFINIRGAVLTGHFLVFSAHNYMK